MNSWLNLIVLLTLASCATPGLCASQSLFELIGERLDLMDEVAVYKFRNKLPIEDIERERIVLANVERSAQSAGLDPDTTRFFFEVQIEAAKEIQAYWFEKFVEGNQVPAAIDLNETVRPELIRLGDEITRAIKVGGAVSPNDESLFLATIDVAGLSESMKLTLFRALSMVHRFPDRLTQIRSTGVLRIGTTGDYAPFSFAESDAGFQGIDIEMARDLANHLSVDVEFYRTSWPRLMQDLANGKFDVGMSGISFTEERQQTAFFSSSYFIGGKTPIARCEDSARFNSLARIDDKGVRVIVNPGGTNYKFATGNLSAATLLIHKDNRTIFDEIAAGRADVMITDSIEVELKANTYPELCATMPGKTLTHQEKAYLLPQEEALKEAVDAWLAKKIKDGTFDQIFERHMGAPAH